MKKLTLAVLTATALCVGSYAQAGSGFSRSSSSSSSSSKAVSTTSRPSAPAAYRPVTPKQSSGGFAYSGSGASKPQGSGSQIGVSGNSAAPKSGFSAAPKSSGSRVAGVAAASALGGALYAANANKEAVATYEAQQGVADRTVSNRESGTRTAPTVRDRDTHSAQMTPSPSYTPNVPAVPPMPVTIVREVPMYVPPIVINQGTPRYHQDQGYTASPANLNAQPTASVSPVVSTTGTGAGTGVWLVVLLVMAVLVGALVYLLTANRKTDAGGKSGTSAHLTNPTNYKL